jgi:type IV pilus assembly protein PilC
MVGSLDYFRSRKLRFFEGLLSLYRGTGDLRRALGFLAERLGPTREGMAARQALRELESGRTLTEAMADSLPGLTAFERGLLEVGEHAGNLDQALEGIALEHRSIRESRLELFGRLAYPVFILHFAGLVFVFVQTLWHGFSVTWPVLYFGLLYAPFLAAWLLLRRARSSLSLQRALLSAPMMGPWLKDRLRSRFAFSLGQLYTAGIPLARALEITAGGITPEVAALEVHEAAAAVRDGRPLTPHLPPILEDAVLRDAAALGEQSGSLTEELERAHRYYRDQAARGLARLVRAAYAATFTLAVLIVVYLVFTVYGGYYSLLR